MANLEAMPQTAIELGEHIVKVRPKVLREGTERDRLYAAYTKFWPDISEYEKHTDRAFPIVLLEPIG